MDHSTHNHTDPADRSDSCPACARADRLLDEDEPLWSTLEEEVTAGRPAVMPEAEPEATQARSSREPVDEHTSTHTDRDHRPEQPEPAPEPVPTAGRPAVPVAVGTTAMIPLDEILDDPDDNIARGCAKVADSTKFRRLVESLKTRGQQQPIRVRLLKPPVGKQRYRVIFGFRRTMGARSLGWTEIEAKVVEADDTQAMLMNWAEGNRADAGDYAISMGLVACKRRGFDIAAAAKEIGWNKGDALMHINIIEKCPEELLRIFRADSSKKTLMLLERISLIEEPSPDATHRAQLAEWDAARALEEEHYRNPPPKPKKTPEKKTIGIKGTSNLSDAVHSANEWYNTRERRYKPLTDEMKLFADALFRAFRGGVRPNMR